MDEENILVDRYEIEERLGAGGMAVVFRAHDRLLERRVSIKVLRKGFSADPEFRERFRQEAKAAANLSHPNLITVYDFGLDSEHLFIVMEYMPGEDLKVILNSRGQLEIDESVQLMIQACAGIGYAHRAGLVHCDIKPHNLLVSPDQRLKVTDFGIARALASIHPEEQVDYVWGSPQYFSPEQAKGGAPSPASDVYSLGMVMYEMLTGRLPFEGDNAEELSEQHRETLPPSPRDFNPKISPELEQIVLKVLSKEPAARYRTADQLGRVLLSYRATGPAPTPKPKPAPAATAETLGPKPELVEVRATNPSRSWLDDLLEVDWVAILLGLIALIAVGGLIPFWIYVYFVYNPPIP